MATPQTRKQAGIPTRSRDVVGSLAKKQQAPEIPVGGIAVTATAKGFYGGVRVRPGEVFYLTDPRHFSGRWMTRGASAPPAAGAASEPPAGMAPSGAQDTLGE